MTEQTTETQTQDETTEQTQTSVLAGDQTQGDETQTQTTEETTAAPGAPESIDGYEVNVEDFNYDEFKAIPENQEFLERAREAGLDSKSLNFLLGEYNQLLPAIMEGNAALDNEACVSAMKETWGADTDTNFGFAKAAANNAIQNGILTPEEVNSPEFGNNPLVLKMAAYFGQQLNEDTPPSNTQQSGGVDVQSLMESEAYLNDKHPDHRSVSAQVERYYSKTYK
ncbi:hypothetical protein IQR32_03680 [Acinetobacter albensis]|uniref:hypothetical protein n=1 Tax=Acinetobacter albensis TaxID=1673609 RepID=UPI00187E3DC5|nr:hypothetical protein [Acinetobacter albensis]MBE9400452.1 hypothetical protein [Acinetobacter albensis]